MTTVSNNIFVNKTSVSNKDSFKASAVGFSCKKCGKDQECDEFVVSKLKHKRPSLIKRLIRRIGAATLIGTAAATAPIEKAEAQGIPISSSIVISPVLNPIPSTNGVIDVYTPGSAPPTVGYLQFDTSSLSGINPSDISSITLRLYGNLISNNNPGVDPNFNHIELFKDDGTSIPNAVNLIATSSRESSSFPSWVDFNIVKTNASRLLGNNTAKFGIYDQKSGRTIEFSNSATNLSLAPQLIVNYTNHPTTLGAGKNAYNPGNHTFTFTVSNPRGKALVIEKSEDLQNWTPVSTNASSTNYVVTVPAKSDKSFFRTKEQ